MSAGTSQCQLQEIVLGSDVADFATWRLVVTCRDWNSCARIPGPCNTATEGHADYRVIQRY